MFKSLFSKSFISSSLSENKSQESNSVYFVS